MEGRPPTNYGHGPPPSVHPSNETRHPPNLVHGFNPFLQQHHQWCEAPPPSVAAPQTISNFDPFRSLNPFINGSLVYRFVWGDPLCVRCGYTGHLPKHCQQQPLSHVEQNYLYQLMRQEQERSKVERELMTGNLGPVNEAVMRADGPKIGREGGFDGTARLIDEEMTVKRIDDLENVNQERRGQVKGMALDTRRESVDRATALGLDGAVDTHPIDTQDTHAKVDGIAKMNKSKKSKAKKKKGEVRGKKPDTRPDAKPLARGPPTRDLEIQPHVKQPSTTSPAPPARKDSEPSLRVQTLKMGATKRLSNGEAKAVGPHPSTIRVSAPYITQAAIEKRLQPSALDAQERSQAEAREDSVRLQGVQWLNSVRRALQLPVKTFTTACVYYHKFRLAHPTVEYNWSDAAAASLLTSCKNEDTLKKSRDILAAAYNLKQPGSHDQVGADDPIFEAPSRVVIGLERLVLESGGFDFRSRSPHHTLVKIGKSLPQSEDLKEVAKLAWTILTDLHRTFAPLKQTSATLALAGLELAANFKAASSPSSTCTVKDDLQALDLGKWHSTREEVMETLLDALDLYTHNTGSTILGSKYSLDDLLRIRLAFNKECTDSSIARHTTIQPPPSPDNTNGTANTLRVANGHPTPVSPPQSGSQPPSQMNGAATSQPAPEGGGTLRFMLDPQRATDERTQVNSYYTEEWEEYEEEIEVPIPRNHSRDHDRRDRADRDRDRDSRPPREPRDFEERRGPRGDRTPQHPRDRERERVRESLADREREAERERARLRDRERDRRYDDRRYEDRERGSDRRYDDRRERDRDGRRYYEDDRRRGREDRR
ncbi:hypothetical protein PRZ48_004054 [Zasmidium cellare]|uniref:RNA polymerase II holoenzyme cyclin-like subunit n=1 Tax=Zasmidium cellare TaxID=395010 RepID=A0ABR0EWS5_ZASCE|nr:hypothetical protein PRZ48_004054 [Zasmidium cellare]